MLLPLLVLIYLLPSLAAETHYFLQFTDLHFDPLYSPGAPNNCELIDGSLGCCRSYDKPVVPYRAASIWGDYNCDIPITLLKGTFEWVAENLPQIDSILLTGDLVGHHDFDQNLTSNLQTVRNVTTTFRQIFPNIPWIPVLGNHDSYLVDQSGGGKYQIFLTAVASYWNLSTDVDFTTGGYYNVLLAPKLRVIILNSELYDSNNFLGIEAPLIAVWQWDWLAQTLRMASREGVKVWLVGHIPPGSGEMRELFSVGLQKLVEVYRDTIVAQFWGHTHNDQFVLYRDHKGMAYAQAYISPSLMPDQRNPSFRVFAYDSETYEVSDYWQYWANLSEVIETNKLDYVVSYQASVDYRMSDLSLNSWDRVASELKSNQTLFEQYYQRYYSNYNRGPCDPQCQKALLCEINWVDKVKYQKCLL